MSTSQQVAAWFCTALEKTALVSETWVSVSVSVTLRHPLLWCSQGIFPIIHLFASPAAALSICLICPKTKPVFLSCCAFFTLLFIWFLEDFGRTNTPPRSLKDFIPNLPQTGISQWELLFLLVTLSLFFLSGCCLAFFLTYCFSKVSQIN